MKPLPAAMLLLLPVLGPAAATAQLPPEADTLFAYDTSAPTDARDSLLEDGEVRVYDLTYASPRGGRVTAYLVTPTTGGRHAGVLFGHWAPGSRTEFLAEAKLLARSGAVCLLIDYPWVRPAPWRVPQGSGLEDADRDMAVFAQVVVDLRRGIDLLSSRSDVDKGRIAYVGHSYGAQWGAILSAIDDRVRAAVLMAGVPSDSVFLLESTEPWTVAIREGASPEAMATYLRRVTQPFAAIRYVPYARPTPLLFQFALKEREFGVGAMRRYFAAASEPKEVLWYDTGHELNDPRALTDRSAWLWQHVGPATASAAGAVSASLDSLAWLAGCWEGTAGSGRIISEVWMTPLGGMMLGAARAVRNGRTTGYEYARIEQRADGTVRYVALPSGQRETAFALVSLEGRTAVFENPNHDFPQRIIYRLVSPDSLAARVESIDPAAGGGEDYGYRKADR